MLRGLAFAFAIISVSGVGLSQTGHVLNDIKTLFSKYEDLKRQMWSVQAQVSEMRTSAIQQRSFDSVTATIMTAIAANRAADSATAAGTDQKIAALGTAASGPGPAQTSESSWIGPPIIVAAGAAILSLVALLLVAFRSSNSARLRKHLHDRIGRLHADDAPAWETSSDERKPVEERVHHGPQIPKETLTRRSEIMRQLRNTAGRTTMPKRQPENAEHRRHLTERATQLIMLTSRGNLTDDERQVAEEEIAEILREMMALR